MAAVQLAIVARTGHMLESKVKGKMGAIPTCSRAFIPGLCRTDLEEKPDLVPISDNDFEPIASHEIHSFVKTRIACLKLPSSLLMEP